MNAIYTLHYSPDDGGHYAEFFDRDSGRDIAAPNGRRLLTAVRPTRHLANRQAQQIKNALTSNRKFMTAVAAANGRSLRRKGGRRGY